MATNDHLNNDLNNNTTGQDTLIDGSSNVIVKPSQTIEEFLDNEKNKNRKDTWNKLDRTTKLQKLHQFAETYGKEKSLPMKEIKILKQFFKISLEKRKLQKTKEVVYDKIGGTIKSIPGLMYNNTSNQYTLRNTEKKVSTLKSLTPTATKSL